MTYKMLLGLAAAGAVMSGPALAVTFGPDGGSRLQGVLDSHTVTPAGNSSVNVLTDALSDELDSYWSVNASGGALATIVVELAGYSGNNTFGIFDASDSTKRVEVFNGVASTGSQALISIMADGSVRVNFADTGVDFASGNRFGFYLGVPDANSVWYSDTALNSDGLDHLVAYQGQGDVFDVDGADGFSAGVWGPGEYILGWEDLPGGGDRDYEDFVVMVESVSPVPDGGTTMVLLGLGLVGAAALRRRRV